MSTDSRKRTLDSLMWFQGDSCLHCKKPLQGEACEIDHKVRLADGGTEELSNKCVLCVTCHRAKTRRENIIAASAHDEPLNINDVIRKIQPAGVKQIAQRYSIQQVRGWWLDKKLRNASCNRDPVWDVPKQREFIWTLLLGGAVPPLYVNKLFKENVREVYDGGNRLNAMMSFMDGDLHIQTKLGRRVVFGYYGPPKETPSRVQHLDRDVQKRFEDIMIDMFEWDNLNTDEATENAMHLNEPAPMCIGEKLKLMTGRNTPRAKILKYLYESDDFKSLMTSERERELKILALFLRNIISPDMVFSSALTSNLAPLYHFYKSTEMVEPEHIERAEKIISETARLLKERTKGQRMILICFIGILNNKYDVQGALNSTSKDVSVEQLLQRHALVQGSPRV